MSFFNAATKARVDAIHLEAFDSYARSVQFTFYGAAREVVVEDPNFLYEFDSIDSQTNEMTAVSASFDCCLIYLLRQEFADFAKGEDTNIRYKAVYNRIRLQVKEEAFESLKNAERFVFGEEQYAIEQAWRKLGSFGNFIVFELTLQRIV